MDLRRSPFVRFGRGSITKCVEQTFKKGLTLEYTPDCRLSMGAKKAVSHAAKIGQVAQETGLSIDTIRFYEREGLLKPSPRTEGGFRLFAASGIETLKFVRKAQELGFLA